ncbi:hypothetical protein ABB37_07507 [Leptomonas pyrrhocoris]|uniref:Uncharacterized protein n=1 Tax=Leptomonas pyrrhocoris TaxID=157538 RepID=A0A0M9FV59_LEPPY|nr:hypothetical protein ABB37_07507 [Leptomonas pyrrhocoris]KPA76653.1 hypothetical protein ABB37_07507 [Leptomonas pyrrhocoris]|eukprot:XP_015655092.1 hypothetical protein ABB37_07507 [Leptomonas pyrrhocoris]
MSGQQTSAPVAAAPAARNATAAAPTRKSEGNAAAIKTSHITCFACSRCEYPICDSNDLLLRKVRQGASDYAFQYDLDGLLDLEEKAVPCYSAAEVVHTSVVVSEALMKVPLPPAAQVVALESIVQSRKFWVQQRRSMNARLHEHGVALLSGTGTATTESSAQTATAGAGGGMIPASASINDSATATTTAETASDGPIVRRYGGSTESRIDLVCVRDSVLETGVQECTQDRSAAATTLDSSPNATNSSQTKTREGDAHSPGSTAPTVIHDPSFAHVPADVLKAATASAAKTQWSSPGNMSLREAYMEVNRTTLSSRAQWFHDYRCVGRVQCPDCHQALGFVFRAAESTKTSPAAAAATAAIATTSVPAVAATAGIDAPPPPTQGVKRPATAHDRDGEDGTEADGRGVAASVSTSVLVSPERREVRGAIGGTVDANAVEDRHGLVTAGHAEVDGARLPHAKKTKNENDAQAAATATARRGFQEVMQRQQRLRSGDAVAGGRASGEGDSSSGSERGEGTPRSGDTEGEMDAPPRFVGLELKRIVQRDWDLRSFQNRYSKSRELSTFRELFPEAEELQSLYSRLLGLRTQTELYNSLLRRHKEQNDVQMALLNSNKDRMHTYDEKIKTMQQIIEAQRAQIEMQTRQIRNQEELVQSHRRQFATQQRQMDVEQLLLSQQSKTIDSQKEQLRLLKLHFQTVRPEVLAGLHQARNVPPSSSLLDAEADADLEVSQGGARTAAVAARRMRKEDSAEEDWADTEDEDEEEEKNSSAVGERESPPSTTNIHRSMPPAHLCSVPSSYAARHARSTESADEASHSSSPPE